MTPNGGCDERHDGLAARGGADKSLADQVGNKLQRTNSGFIQHTSHEAQ